jgi:hypothetical protein
MELRTEMREQSPLMCDFDALNHDAAAAYAMRNAIWSWELESDENGIDETQSPRDAVRWIKCHAAELMRSWGFTEQAGGDA